MLLMWFCTV